MEGLETPEQAILKQVLAYITSPDTSVTDNDQLSKIVNGRPNRLPFTLTVPMDELDERVELINHLWKILPGCTDGNDTKVARQTRAWFQAALVPLSIPTLRSFKNNTPALVSYCEKTKSWAIFVNRGIGLPRQNNTSPSKLGRDKFATETDSNPKQPTQPASPESSAGSSKWETLKRRASNVSVSASQVVRRRKKSEKSTSVDELKKDTNEARNQRESIAPDTPLHNDHSGRDSEATKATKKRDGKRCVITGRGGPLHAAHIGSHATTKDDNAVHHLQSHWEVADIVLEAFPGLSDELAEIFVQGKPGDADKPFNMVTLDPYMHYAWDYTYFGLKPLGFCGWQHIQLQFCWFYTNKINADARDEFTAEDLKGIYEKADVQIKFGDVSSDRMSNGRLLQTGDIITVRCSSNEEAGKMLKAFRFRWAASQFQFLAGAAGVDFEDPDEPDWTDPKIRSWYWEETDTEF